MSIRIWVGPLLIAGIGLFARQSLKKSTRIMQYIGQRIAKAETADALIGFRGLMLQRCPRIGTPF
jgi:hypothetical protein